MFASLFDLEYYTIGMVQIEAFRTGKLKGSWAHAHGLNYATNRAQTPYTVVVMGPDIHLFKEKRNDFLIGD